MLNMYMVAYTKQIGVAIVTALAFWSPVCVFAGEAEWNGHMVAADIFKRAGDNRNAAVRYEAALREAESFGTSDFRLARTLNNLADTYVTLGRLT